MFSEKDINQLLKWDRIDGANKRIRKNWDGKKRAAYIYATDPSGKKHFLKVSTAWDHTAERMKATAKVQGTRKTKKPKLIGPKDLKNTNEFQDILKGKKLEFPFLSDFQNKILTYRVLKKSLKQIARAFSGGWSKRSYTASQIRYQLHDARKKIRKHRGVIQMANCSFNLPQKLIGAIKQKASERKISRSELVTEALNFYLQGLIDGVVELDWGEYMELCKKISIPGNGLTQDEMDSFFKMENSLWESQGAS